MIQLTSKSTAEHPLVGYYDLLTKTGYVKSGRVRKLLLYSFLVNFVEEFSHFITQEDYKQIQLLLTKLFASGDCLLPYPVFCFRRAKLGPANYSEVPPPPRPEPEPQPEPGSGSGSGSLYDSWAVENGETA